MADNTEYLAKLLQGNKGDISQYTDIVNRRSAADDIGDGFLEQSKQPAVNGKQRLANAMKSGFGSGLKSGATSVRDTKLQEIEKYTKQVAITAANLQTQLGQSAYKKAAFANYATDNFGDLKKWNDALGSGDGVNSNDIGALLFNRFKDTYPDLAEGMGNFSHVYNGMLYTNEGNKSQGIPIKDIIAPFISTLPEEQQRELPNLNTLTMQNKFKQSDLLTNLAIERERAGIAKDYSQVRKADYEMNSPKPKYSDQVSAHMYKANIDWVNNLRNEHDLLKQEQQAYQKIGELIAKESEWHGRAGKNTITMAQRLINTSGTESEKNQALIELYKQPLMAGIKKIFAGSTSDLDIATYVAGLPSLDKNPEAAIQIAQERATKLGEKIQEDELTAEVLEQDFGFGEPYQSRAVQEKVKARKQKIGTTSTQPSSTSKIRFTPNE